MPPSPPPLPTCSLCQTSLDPNGTCPRCRAPEDWNDQIEALDFVLRRLGEWHQNGQMSDRQRQAFADIYDKRKQMMSAAASTKQTFQPDAPFRGGMNSGVARNIYTRTPPTTTRAALPSPIPQSARYGT